LLLEPMCGQSRHFPSLRIRSPRNKAESVRPRSSRWGRLQAEAATRLSAGCPARPRREEAFGRTCYAHEPAPDRPVVRVRRIAGGLRSELASSASARAQTPRDRGQIGVEVSNSVPDRERVLYHQLAWRRQDRPANAVLPIVARFRGGPDRPPQPPA